MQITIEVSDSLGHQLQAFQDRLPEVLERGIQELLSERSLNYQDQQEIMALLASLTLSR